MRKKWLTQIAKKFFHTNKCDIFYFSKIIHCHILKKKKTFFLFIYLFRVFFCLIVRYSSKILIEIIELLKMMPTIKFIVSIFNNFIFSSLHFSWSIRNIFIGLCFLLCYKFFFILFFFSLSLFIKLFNLKRKND